MTNRYVDRIKSGLPLLLGGAFMIYLAAVDNTIFDYILDNVGQTQLTIAAATVAASAPLMFFAIGFLKLAILHEWQAIYQYEALLRKDIFYIMAIILLVCIVAITIIHVGVHILNIHILVGCLGFSVYLIRYVYKCKSGNL